MQSIQSNKPERGHQCSYCCQPDQGGRGKLSHHEEFYGQESTSCRVARNFRRPDRNDAVDSTHADAGNNTSFFSKSASPSIDEIPRNQTYLESRTVAFHLNSKTLLGEDGAFCSRKMACDPKLLPNRKDMPRNVRTAAHPCDVLCRSL